MKSNLKPSKCCLNCMDSIYFFDGEDYVYLCNHDHTCPCKSMYECEEEFKDPLSPFVKWLKAHPANIFQSPRYISESSSMVCDDYVYASLFDLLDKAGRWEPLL